MGSFVIRLWLTWHATVASKGSSLTSLWSNIYGNPWQTIRRCLRTRCNRCCCRIPGQRHGFIFKVLVWISVLCHFPCFSLTCRSCSAFPFNLYCQFLMLLCFTFGVFAHKKGKPLRETVYFSSHFVVPDWVCKLKSNQSEGSVSQAEVVMLLF